MNSGQSYKQRGFRKMHAFLIVLALAALALTAITAVLRARPLTNIFELLIVVGAPYVPLLAFSGFVLLALCRRVVLSIGAALLVVLTVAVQANWSSFGHPTDIGQYTEIRVLSSNLRKGQAEAPAFVSLANESADVVTVSELTPDAVERFSKAGLDDAFPYSVLFPAPGAGGIGIWSRFPMAEVASAKSQTSVAARLEVPDVRLNPLVASIHVYSPLAYDANSFDGWENSIARVGAELEDLASAAGPGSVIVGGDFNSTPDMYQFRSLLTDGYRDSVEQTGAGFAPSFPSRNKIPSLITIDHVLTRNAATSSIITVRLPGADHRALLATIKVPLDPTAS